MAVRTNLAVWLLSLVSSQLSVRNYFETFSRESSKDTVIELIEFNIENFPRAGAAVSVLMKMASYLEKRGSGMEGIQDSGMELAQPSCNSQDFDYLNDGNEAWSPCSSFSSCWTDQSVKMTSG